MFTFDWPRFTLAFQFFGATSLKIMLYGSFPVIEQMKTHIRYNFLLSNLKHRPILTEVEEYFKGCVIVCIYEVEGRQAIS